MATASYALHREEVVPANRVVPLNCVDKALLALDSRNERMVFHIMLGVQGEIDPIRLNQAVSFVMSIHPTMRSLLRAKWFRHFREVQEDFDGKIVTVWDVDSFEASRRPGEARSDATPERLLFQWINRPIDPTKDLPVRVLLLKRKVGDYSIVFTFHHHAADGIRCLRVIREVIDKYNGEPAIDPLPTEDACNLHKRNEVVELVKSSRSKTGHLPRQVPSNLFRRFAVASLPPPARIFHDGAGPPSGEVGYLHRVLDAVELKQIDSKARASGATLNDLLLASCFRVVEKWNQQHGIRCKKISIMVPVDVGRRASRQVVSNQVSYISPATSPQDRADPAALLRKTSTARIRLLRDGGAVSIIYFTYFLSFLPLPALRGIGRLLLRTRLFVDSILVTNVGPIWLTPRSSAGRQTSIGDATIHEVTGVTPVVTPFRMGIYAGIYNEALNIALTYRTSLVSEEKAQAFLDLYIEDIRKYPPGQHSDAMALKPSDSIREIVQAQ